MRPLKVFREYSLGNQTTAFFTLECFILYNNLMVWQIAKSAIINTTNFSVVGKANEGLYYLFVPTIFPLIFYGISTFYTSLKAP